MCPQLRHTCLHLRQVSCGDAQYSHVSVATDDATVNSPDVCEAALPPV